MHNDGYFEALARRAAVKRKRKRLLSHILLFIGCLFVLVPLILPHHVIKPEYAALLVDYNDKSFFPFTGLNNQELQSLTLFDYLKSHYAHPKEVYFVVALSATIAMVLSLVGIIIGHIKQKVAVVVGLLFPAIASFIFMAFYCDPAFLFADGEEVYRATIAPYFAYIGFVILFIGSFFLMSGIQTQHKNR